MTFKTSTSGPNDTSRLGVKLAGLLLGGEVIELASDLGGGKTVLVGGIAKGLGIIEPVASPTFTVSRIYRLPDGRELHHFDFYRLAPDDLVATELAEVAGDPGIITAIEWAGQVGSKLPADRIRIAIENTGDDSRDIEISSTSDKFDYVIEGLDQ
jgi:tRNA threonylcarbamoyladenosine biosynthesis protein TsaE